MYGWTLLDEGLIWAREACGKEGDRDDGASQLAAGP